MSICVALRVASCESRACFGWTMAWTGQPAVADTRTCRADSREWRWSGRRLYSVESKQNKQENSWNESSKKGAEQILTGHREEYDAPDGKEAVEELVGIVVAVAVAVVVRFRMLFLLHLAHHHVCHQNERRRREKRGYELLQAPQMAVRSSHHFGVRVSVSVSCRSRSDDILFCRTCVCVCVWMCVLVLL